MIDARREIANDEPERTTVTTGGDLTRFDKAVSVLADAVESLRHSIEAVVDPLIDAPYESAAAEVQPKQTGLADRIEQVERLAMKLERIREHVRL